jgi:hypothetical protein
MTEHTPGIPHPPILSRNLLDMWLDGNDEANITVDHVYLPEGAGGTCHCGNPVHDPGLVGLSLNDDCALLTAEQALLLANRLQRAASLILESGEAPPDVEREAARYTPVKEN